MRDNAHTEDKKMWLCSICVVLCMCFCVVQKLEPKIKRAHQTMDYILKWAIEKLGNNKNIRSFTSFFSNIGLTEEEDLIMSSDVNRQAVFQTTKVRTHLKKDGSWIQRSQEVLDTQSDVKCKPAKLVKPKNESSPESSRVTSSIIPCSKSGGTASSSLDTSTTPQSSYVMSALRKFEPVSSTENTPVKRGSHLAKSPYPVLEESKRAHTEDVTVKPVEEPPKTPADAPVVDKPIVKLLAEPLKKPADAYKKDVVEKPIVKPAEEPLKTPADPLKKDVVEKLIVKPAEEPLKTPADPLKKDVVEKLIVKPAEEPLKTPADALKKDVVEKLIVKPVEEPLKTPADALKKDVVEKTIVKPVEEPLKTPADALKKDVVEKPIVKPVEEPLKTPADALQKDVVEKTIVKPVEEPLKTPADALKKDVVEKPIVKPVEEPLKTPADALQKDVVEKTIVKPVEEPLKTPADALKKDVVEKPIVKPVEEPLKTPADALQKDVVEKTIVKPVEEPLKTPADTSEEVTGKKTVEDVLTDQRQSSGALDEKTEQNKTLHEKPSKPSGVLTTEKKEDSPVEQLITAHAPVGENPLKPRQAENQPPSNGELSLVSALKTPTTEPTEEPLVEATAEHHRVNSEAGLSVKDKTMCSICKLPLNGSVKIIINIPNICCHPDCFKCNGCNSPLGDLSSSIYHYAGKVLCERCFEQIFQL
ncbi:neurofilament heavy polypeptide isoform X2 [Pimephales promelas]|uniref:neurofilament heavy polypeptide isoform X2 n=1 Tax=Pimephales promelas TaxID=90988 RepID=UPI0019556C10|nr:neurofilament heavy polypeptide isoform X2 [Pimephales promelas]